MAIPGTDHQDMGSSRRERGLGKAYGLFAAALAVFVVVIAVVGQLGLTDRITAFLMLGATLATFVAVGLAARSLSLADFLVARRAVPAGLNGLATAAAFLSAGGVVGTVGVFFGNGPAALVVVVGWCFGFVVLAVLVAPYFRNSGALTVPDFLAVRFGGPIVRPVAVIAVVAIAMIIAPASIVAATMLTETMVGVDPMTALTGIVIVIIASALFGGMRAVTLVAGVQMIIALFGILAPAGIAALRDYGLPVPQLAFGGPAAEIAAASSIHVLASRLQPLGALGGLNWLGFGVALAAGIACLPHVLCRSATTPSAAGARRSAAWALAVVAVIAVTVPAIAALTRIALLQDLVGVDFADFPDWLFDYGDRGLIQVCGVDAVSAAALGAACGAATVLNGLTPADIAIAGDSVLLAFAVISRLPLVFSALITTSLIGLALATAGTMLIAAAASLGHDVYGALVNRRATTGRRLIIGRAALVMLIALATWLSVDRPDAMLALAPFAPSLAASTFFAAIVLGIWWRGTTPPGALAGILVGFTVSVAYVALTNAGIIDRWTLLGLCPDGLADAATAIIGVPASVLATVAGSLLTAPKASAMGPTVVAIRHPNADMVSQDPLA